MPGGVYAGVFYQVVKKGEKYYIVIQPGIAMGLRARGANLKLLDNIGEQDPDDVMEALLDSIPEEKGE